MRIHFPLVEFFRPATALALLAGALAVQTLPALPPRWLELALVAAGIAAFVLRNQWRWLGLFVLGAAWAMLRADIALSHRLASALEGEDITVTGSIHGLPRVQDDGTRFEFDVRDAGPTKLSGRLRLSWYEGAPELAPCAQWRLQLRLKRPRGMIDPGGFDFERYALEQGIVATGYVRESDDNKELGADAICVDRLRARIVDGITATLGDVPSAHLLRALAFGDQHAMDEHEWAVARATGIPHLIAISGLHIALFASFGVLLVRLLWKMAPRLTLRWPAPLIEAVASLMFAVSYALIAGFGLPTRRALVMIAACSSVSLRAGGRLALAVVALLRGTRCACSVRFWFVLWRGPAHVLSRRSAGWLARTGLRARRCEWVCCRSASGSAESLSGHCESRRGAVDRFRPAADGRRRTIDPVARPSVRRCCNCRSDVGLWWMWKNTAWPGARGISEPSA